MPSVASLGNPQKMVIEIHLDFYFHFKQHSLTFHFLTSPLTGSLYSGTDKRSNNQNQGEHSSCQPNADQGQKLWVQLSFSLQRQLFMPNGKKIENSEANVPALCSSSLIFFFSFFSGSNRYCLILEGACVCEDEVFVVLSLQDTNCRDSVSTHTFLEDLN